MQVQPYLNFDGRCEEAIEFYKKAVGAEVTMLMRYKDSPEPCGMVKPEGMNKVMHASFQIGSSMIMASDCHNTGAANFQGITLSISVAKEEAAHKVFNALADGGKIGMPLTKTFFSPAFGVLTDRFGVAWMVVVMA
jgi:PhnB protein